jgi:hypothetical protein
VEFEFLSAIGGAGRFKDTEDDAFLSYKAVGLFSDAIDVAFLSETGGGTGLLGTLLLILGWLSELPPGR